MTYNCTKFQEISQRVSELLSGCGLYTKFLKGHNSVKSVGGVMILVLFTLPDSVLYLYQLLSKYLIRFQSYEPEH